MMKILMSPHSAGCLPAGWSSVPLEECGLGGVLACPVCPMGVPSLSTHTPTLLTRERSFHPTGWAQCFAGALQAQVGWCLWVPSRGMDGSPMGRCLWVPRCGMGSVMGWCPWIPSHGMGSAVGWCLWVRSCGMGSAHPWPGASFPQLVAGRAPQSGQPHVVAPSGSLALLPTLTWSHSPLLAPMLHPSPPSFGTLPGRLSQLWLLCARPGFGTSGLATHPHCPQPRQGAGTHPGTPAPRHPRYPSTLGVLLPMALSGLPSRETCQSGAGCLGKQALALAGHPRQIKTSGRAAAQRVREAGTP